MKITVKLEISKETGETYRVLGDGTYENKEGVMVVNFGDVIGISIKNSLPDAVIKALGNMQGAWMPTRGNRSLSGYGPDHDSAVIAAFAAAVHQSKMTPMTGIEYEVPDA